MAPPNPVAPAGYNSISATTFEDAWKSAEVKIQHGQYVDALLSLSLLYEDEGLQEPQRSRLISVLDQLAGTVIYSREHLLERPHETRPGDTWEGLAAAYQVPPDFLARVNGLPAEVPPPPGERLKVVRGPFRGELSASRRELTLYLNRYYAGRFNVGIGRDLPPQVSQLVVAGKSGPQAYPDPRSGQLIPAGVPENPYGQYRLALTIPGQPVDPVLAIHSVGERIEAADTRGCITVSPRDADDLQAIFSVGSRLTVVR